jgi:hypothetical protein
MIGNTQFLVILGCQFAYLVFTEIRNYNERKSLLNRIMSRDFEAYYEQDLQVRKAVVAEKKLFDRVEDNHYTQL